MKSYFFSLLSFLLIFTDCAHQITYNFIGVKIEDNEILKNLSISVQTFIDNRKEASYLKDKLFDTLINNDSECFNIERNYRKNSVCKQLANILYKHIDTMQIFKKVYFNKKESSDLYLTINLVSFAAHSTLNTTARDVNGFGSLFGIVGRISSLVITSAMKSNYDFEIKYKNITITDNLNNIIYQLPELTSSNKLEIDAITYCYQLYDLINNNLKKHNKLLISKIISELPSKLITSNKNNKTHITSGSS